VVLGIGNSLLGDDGVGIHVIRDLQAGAPPLGFARPGVEFLDGGTLGYLLIDRIAGADALIVVDAANLGESAGAVRVFLDEDMYGFLNANQNSSVHEVSLVELLQMLTLTDQMPRRCALVGIQPASIDWSTGMSPEVSKSVPIACREIDRVLCAWRGPTEP
jgi:hydrogenase maturation protease